MEIHGSAHLLDGRPLQLPLSLSLELRPAGAAPPPPDPAGEEVIVSPPTPRAVADEVQRAVRAAHEDRRAVPAAAFRRSVYLQMHNIQRKLWGHGNAARWSKVADGLLNDWLASPKRDAKATASQRPRVQVPEKVRPRRTKTTSSKRRRRAKSPVQAAGGDKARTPPIRAAIEEQEGSDDSISSSSESSTSKDELRQRGARAIEELREAKERIVDLEARVEHLSGLQNLVT
jgi:hypothetical protein